MKNQNSYLNKKRSSKDKLIRKKSSKKIKVKGPWSEHEDKLLKKWIEEHGPKNWARCAETIKGRNGKQCREHWNNSLNYNIVKGGWSTDEDLFIMVFYSKLEKSWKKMIPLFKTRTENAIKNRFFSQLRKITAKFVKKDRSEYNSKFKLGTLLDYYNLGIEEAKKDFLKEHPMSEEKYNSFIKEVEDKVKNKKEEQKFIELDNIKNKYFLKNNDTNADNNNKDNNNKKEEEEKENNINIIEINNNDNNNIENNNNNEDEGSINSITEPEDDKDKEGKIYLVINNEDNRDKNINDNDYQDENKKIGDKNKTDNKNIKERTSNINITNSKIINNLSELRKNLSSNINNIIIPNNLNNNTISNNYIYNIFNSNFQTYNTNMNNIKENNNLNNYNNYTLNNMINNRIIINNDLNNIKQDPNLSPFMRKPSDVGVSDYNKNTIFKGYNMRNNSFNNYDNIESPFYPYFRFNSNSVYDFNNSINNPNSYFNSFPNFINKDSGVVNAFRRTDSNELNKLNRINYPFNTFGYKRSTSFGSIKDGKIFDNYNNDDINKQ